MQIKKLLLTIATTLIITIGMQAQNDTLYIMKSGVIIGKYNINNQIDSIIFYNPFPDSSSTVMDADSNIYHTIIIGSQVWMKENLKTTKYNDSTSIPLVDNSFAWESLNTPGYCWYDNDEATYKHQYGALYNWYAVNTGMLCPTGWHVATDADWTALENYLGGNAEAGGKLKETGTAHWNSPNTNATNDVGFTALPGGIRSYNGSFYYVGEKARWWTSTVRDVSDAWLRYVSYDSSYLERTNYPKENGFSVRCIMD